MYHKTAVAANNTLNCAWIKRRILKVVPNAAKDQQLYKSNKSLFLEKKKNLYVFRFKMVGANFLILKEDK